MLFLTESLRIIRLKIARVIAKEFKISLLFKTLGKNPAGTATFFTSDIINPYNQLVVTNLN